MVKATKAQNGRAGRPAGGPARFIVLAGARTGSNMLVQALDSSPHMRCFGEVFNAALDHISYGVDGYDNFNARDRSLRDRDAVAFLRKRVFKRPPAGVRAVGFKLLYAQDAGFADLLDHLTADEGLRVLHLRRRNLLRTLVSWKIANGTGLWVQNGASPLDDAFSLTNARRAARHPLRAAAALRRRLRLRASSTNERPQATLSRDECMTLFGYVQRQEARYDMLFAGHPKRTLYYEDIVAAPEQELGVVQEFLAVTPQPLTVTARRQNPEPLRDLLANYDELRAAFRATPYAPFFEEREAAVPQSFAATTS